MFGTLQKAFRPSPNDSLSASFQRPDGWFLDAGRSGVIPLALTIYALFFGRNPAAGTRAGFPLIQYLSLAGLLVLVFTTLWSYRYTRLAARIADPGAAPTKPQFRERCGQASRRVRSGFCSRDRHVFRSRTAADLLSSRTPGRNSGCSDDERRSGELGIRSRHRRAYGPPPHNVRRSCRPCLQSLALVPDDDPFR